MYIDAHTRPVALFGYPLSHTRSPLIHNTAFQHQRLNYLYLATPVAPHDIPAAVAGLKVLHFLGANVTIPHKQAVLPLMDEVSPQAEAVKAINTIVCRREGEAVTLYGDNTDVAGFLEPLASFEDRLMGAEMLVWGAGGAARAVVYALLSAYQPTQLTVTARTAKKAERLAKDLAPYDLHGALRVVTPDAAAAAVQSGTLLVNATPLGMHPDLNTTPWSHRDDFNPTQIVYDLVYNPTQTRLLHDAVAQGATPVGGLDMLIAQAAAAYIQWTGQAMPIHIVRTALLGDV